MGEGSCKLHSNMRDFFFFFFFAEAGWLSHEKLKFLPTSRHETSPILRVTVYFTQFSVPAPEDTPTEQMFFMQMCDLMWGDELFVANNQGTNSSKLIVVYLKKKTNSILH